MSGAASDKFVEGVDFYFEDGLMVLTEHYLLKRGYCCENACRHCPYRERAAADQSR
ncbi:MAG: hypothetical protein HKN25_12665 [Pyrinomonadaceae bacterium]|nr:hypothetical protein [Pyrinomonadaceae bacterium]